MTLSCVQNYLLRNKMIRLKSIGIALAIICSLFLFGMVLTPHVFAQLAKDDHMAKKIVEHDGDPLVSASVSIDSVDYFSGDGSVSVYSTYYVYNYDQKRSITYSGELRLEITDAEGNALLPHAEVPISGDLKKNDEDALFSDVYASNSKDTNLHFACLSPRAKADGRYTAHVNIALNVYRLEQHELWEAPYTYGFTHKPETKVEQLVGIGPTTDGETFSDDCKVNSDDERSNWQSLIYTDIPYQAVYWYVKAPGDSYGSQVSVSWGDGETRKSTMTTSFPDDVDDPNKPRDQDRVFYEITADVYTLDGLYTTSYLVDVYDK